MKKILAMLLAAVMVLGLAACGGSSAPAATEAPAAQAPVQPSLFGDDDEEEQYLV